MNTVRTLGWTVATLASALLLAPAPPVRAQAENPESYGDGYQSGDYGRIRFSDGGALIVRASSEDEPQERAGANAPVFPGDAVRTAANERLEIELAAGSLVRIDRETRVTFQSLPSPYAKFRDNTVLNLDQGVLQIAARIGQEDEFRIETPSASVYLLGDGDFRIEADADHTRVYSRRGVAEVVGEGGSVLVRGGQRTNAYRGIIPEDARAFSSYASDGFDRWVASREESFRGDERVADDGTAEALPDEVRPYYRELSTYGDWVEVPSYGRVWYPHDVPVGWRPYWDGYWDYGPHGYFWVSNEPWGWAPYRYGRWNWVGGYGWCWIPGRVFAGAWVSWSWGTAYFGWAPLDYWGYPAYIGGPYHHGHYDPGCWTFVDHHHMGHHDVRRYAVPVDRVPRGELDGNRVVARAPKVAPRQLAESRDWRERAARQAANEPTVRTRPTDRDRTAGRRLSDVEDRMTRRGGRDLPRAADAPRAERGRSSERGEVPGRTVESPRFPRRVGEDPRARAESRRSTPKPREDAATAPAPRAPRDGGRVDNERRSLYDHVSRPRDVQKGDAGRVVPTPAPRVERREQARGTPREPQRAAPQRSQPQRSEPQRAAPQRSQPQRSEPQRAAPQRSQPQRSEPQRAAPQRSQPRPQQAQPQRRPDSPRPAPAPRREPAKPKQNDGGKGKHERGGR
ncbi:MAG TPA: DUF6600 domain-containing protein [Candidatus Polarisedimenticolaceae bacterium]